MYKAILVPAGPMRIEEQIREDAFISSLDPLHADEMLGRLPALNAAKDTIALVLMLVDMLPSVGEAVRFDAYQASAAMRDIGILLGSLKRHGIEPVHVIPELEDKLNILGNITDLPPRDTLIHYIRWNPEGMRLRTYTGTEDERQLIKSVQLAMHPLLKAILLLDELYSLPLDAPEFAGVCDQVTQHFHGMVEGTVHARRKVNPAYFARELRFYFDAIELNNREYLGPGAVEMPVFVFDHILWNADLEDAAYTAFKQAYVPYSQAMVRHLYARYEGRASLLSKVIAELNDTTGQAFSLIRLQSAKALVKLFNEMKSFRAPHKKIADEAYASQGATHEKGSGGYTPDILQDIIYHQNRALERLKDSMSRYIQHAY